MSDLVALPSGQGSAYQIAYSPTPEVAAFIRDTRYITGFFGPLGCGKTTAGVMKAFFYAQDFPGAKVAVIRDTWPNLRDTTQATFFEWFPPGISGEYHKTEKVYTLRTAGKPSHILFRALDDERDISNVLSLDIAAAWIDEPQGGPTTGGANDPGVAINLYRSLLGRIGRQKGYPLQMLWLTGNPPAPSHWIAKEFGFNGQGTPANPYDDRWLYLGTRDTNRGNLVTGYYERLERVWGTGTPLARRFLDGEWIEFATEQPFHARWIQYYDELPKNLVVEAGFDPAISKNDKAARSALVVAGQSHSGITRGCIYVLDAIAGQWTVLEQVEQLLRAVKKHKVRVVRIEDVAYQKALAEILEREARQAGIPLVVVPVKPDADKLRRANAWSPFVQDGTIAFAPSHRDLIDCMLAVPGDRTKWDLVDAAGICVRGFPAMRGEYSRLPGTETHSPERARSYSVNDGPARPFKFGTVTSGGNLSFKPRTQKQKASSYATRTAARQQKPR